ncbi:hypothetical protein C5C44_03835 [Rathayibacter sp. AY1F6]|uniref:hypothetical protein n=1 Tax=Rathayibacter sp. AY1F6 TaxID=2080560 RepID=UPI000CE8A296|nr:hypothetical protein [Rathayibacter sp. AY1F6]PPH05228.1 hypothetical protein C5C44_03835 [Rathayibacter sp. AY1F6]
MDTTRTTAPRRATGLRAGRRATVLGASALLAALALSGCTSGADQAEEATPAVPGTAAPTTAAPTATPTDAPLGPVTLPEGATAAVRWTDQVGPVDPQTVNLSGDPLHITVSVACDTADAEVTIEVVGLMTSGSSCVYSPSTTRTGTGGGNTGTMQIAVEQDAEIRVTTVPDDAHWSAAVSTGARTVPGP